MVLALVQARYSSTRLPGKVLLPLAGKPMLVQQIERIRRAKNIKTVVVATSQHPSDDIVAKTCADNAIACIRGDLENVLDRFYQAARHYKADIIVRLTGDCPLVDHYVIDSVVDFFKAGLYDYVSNVHPPTFPDGLDVEVFSFEALERAWNEAVLPSHTEHVTPFFSDPENSFVCGNVKHSQDLSAMRWTVDEPEDYQFVSTIYQKLYTKKPDFVMHDILSFLRQHPVLQDLNKRFERNEGLKKSLEADAKFLNGGSHV